MRVNKNGRSYLVTAAGWEDGIGPGASIGTIWMSEGSASWYSVFITGSKNTAALSISQSTLPYGDNSVGYQLVQCDDGNSYFCYLSGTPPTVTFNVSQSAYTGSATPKPDLLLQSVTDGNFYMVTLHDSVPTGGGLITAVVGPNYISASWVYQSGIY